MEIQMSKAAKVTNVATVALNADQLASQVIQGLANLFNYTVTYEDRDGSTVSTNTMRFTLTSALNGLCYSLSRQNDWLVQQLDTQREKAKEALFGANGTEISMNNVRRATERLERIEEEMAALDLMLQKAIVAHDAISPKQFEFKAQMKPLPSKNVDTTNVDVQHLAAKLGVNLDRLPNTDGVH